MSDLGLRTVFVDRFIHQSAGQRSWAHLWNRLLRWKLIWRMQSPNAYIASLLSSALLAALAGAVAAPLMHASPIIVSFATVVGWIMGESLMCYVRGWPLSLRSPIAFLQREVIELLVWLRALTTSEVEWGGERRRCERPRRLKPAAKEAGA
jgi:ceramide glucosyltransferase